MTKLENIVRRAIAAKMPQILRCCQEGRLSSSELQPFIPSYQVVLPAGSPGKQTRMLVPINSKKHGKRRIYSDTSYLGQKGHDVYLSYITKKDLVKIYPELKNSTLFDQFGDRWILTIGRAATSRHRRLTDFLDSIVVHERIVSKSNRPPRGTTDGETSTWKFGPCVEKLTKSFLLQNQMKIICSIDSYR